MPSCANVALILSRQTNPSSSIDDTPTAKLVRQVLGPISEFDKGDDGRKAARCPRAQAPWCRKV